MAASRSHPATAAEVAAWLDAAPVAAAAFTRVHAHLTGLGPVELRLAATQVSWTRRRGFAWLWLPRTWLGDRGAAAVLSLATSRRLASPRWKQVVELRPGLVMHHLELGAPDDVDAEVESWLTLAWQEAG